MSKRVLAFLLAASVWVGASTWAADKKKKDQELPNQVLQLPRELPAVVVAETSRLSFHVAPLTSRGLLSQQVRDGLKALTHITGAGAIVRLRAFVAGTGDMRRVQTIVSETFTDRHLPLPALSVVQVGGLPGEGVQVSLEAVSVGKKEINPHGLALIAGQATVSATPTFQMAPLAEQSVRKMETALAGAGLGKDDVLRATCYMSSLEDVEAVRRVVGGAFPQAALTFVQLQREPGRSTVECEAVARLRGAEGVKRPPQEAQVALVGTHRLAFSGTQMAFGYQDADARLAFQRLDRGLQQAHTSLQQVVMSNFYPLTSGVAEMIRRVRFEFFNKAAPPAATLLEFQGLPSLDASFAMDVIAVVPDNR
jgi:enamine deaminase RidA (YjgF/YER057c/UK114 family)